METRVEKEHIDCAGAWWWQRPVLEHSGEHALNFQIANVSIAGDVQLFLTKSWGEPILNSQALERIQLSMFADTEK